MAKILVVEDEKDLQQVLAWNLTAQGHTVAATTHAAEGLQLLEAMQPDLLILDRMLPDFPGTEVLSQLRRNPNTASTKVILLTACGQDTDRILGFELGADDYVVKPFSLKELLLRISAVLRRSDGNSPKSEEPPSNSLSPKDQISIGPLCIDRSAHRVFFYQTERKLTALEFRLLWTLASQPGKVLTRSHLLGSAWPGWNVDAAIMTRTVDTHIKRLREKLGDSGDLIETVRGVGYRFTTPTEGNAP